MSRYRLFAILLLILTLGLIMSSMVSAQRPGRGDGTATPGGERPGGGRRETPLATLAAPADRPGRGDLTPRPTFERPSFSFTPDPNRPQPTFSLTLPAFAGASVEADAAINGFAGTHLGTVYALLAGGSLNSATLSPEAIALIQSFIAALPAQAQSFIAQMADGSGAAYWGVFQNGMGMVALADCTTNPNCQVTEDNLTLILTSSSGGVYAVYAPASVSDANAALNLLLATYPALTGLSFTPSAEASQGYAFQATAFSRSGTQSISKGVYGGVVPANAQALVYVVIGVGEGYIEMMQPAR